MASNVIRVSLIGDASKLLATFRDSEASAQTWSRNLGKAGRSFTTAVTLPIVAGAGLALKAAAEEGKQMETLANIIRNRIPGATQEAIDANESWITSIQNTTGTADSELREMQQKFLAAGASIEDSQAMAAAAIDTSVATGKELNSVSDAMVKGLNGQTAGFSRLGINVRKADGSMKSFDEILQDLAVHQGTAAASMDTTAGRAEISRLKFADMTETIGTMLLPILDKLSGWLTKIVDWFNSLSPAGQAMIVTLAGVAAAVGPVLLVASKLVTAFGIVGKAFTALKLLMMANPWALLIAAVVALVVLIVTNWDKILVFLKRAWDWIKNAAASVGKFIQDSFKKAVDFLVNLFLNFTPLGLIIKHFDAIVAFVKGLPSRITSAAKGMWDGLKNAFKNALNWIIEKWNSFRITIKLPTILGGGTINIDTPNLPTFHQGGVFSAPTPGGSGLAILKDGERVLTPSQSRQSGGLGTVINLTVNALDPRNAADAVVRALQEWQRTNGALPVNVRQA